MAQIADVAAYFCDRYPHKTELSKTRLTKLVYLADWESVKNRGRQITDIKWYFHNFGPYVDDVFDATTSDSRFQLISTLNQYGEKKSQINLKEGCDKTLGLNSDEVNIIDHVIDETKTMYWNNFIKHVYSTKPIEMSDRYQHLDLISFT